MKAYLKIFFVAKLVSLMLLINILATQSLRAQAPDCEECDAFIDDPGEYAQCIEEHCGTSIPIDNHIEILFVIGLGLGVYTLSRVKHISLNSN